VLIRTTGVAGKARYQFDPHSPSAAEAVSLVAYRHN
jgi:hypothetical protein